MTASFSCWGTGRFLASALGRASNKPDDSVLCLETISTFPADDLGTIDAASRGVFICALGLSSYCSKRQRTNIKSFQLPVHEALRPIYLQRPRIYTRQKMSKHTLVKMLVNWSNQFEANACSVWIG